MHEGEVRWPGWFVPLGGSFVAIRRAVPGRNSAPTVSNSEQASIGAGELNPKRNAADKAPEQPWSTAMLAEIFMLRLEAAARAAKFEAAIPSRFVPITLPASAP